MKQDMMKQTIKTIIALLVLLISSTEAWAGLQLKSNLGAKATVTFYDYGTTEPTTSSFTKPSTAITQIDNSDGKDHYVIVHIVPADGYWTNKELLFAMETGATLAPSMRAPGLDLGQVPTLLKADEGYGNGAGWYYYQIPAAHTTDSYKTSTIDGFVVPKFDLSTATVDATDAKTYHVSNGDWNTTISIDENSFTYNGAAQGPQLSGTTLQIKKGTDDACTLPLSGNVSLSGTETNASATAYNATLSYVANGCFTDTKAVPFSISKKALTITADDASKVYDGTALTKNTYTHTITATGDVIESVTINGSQTNVGNSNNVPSAAVIKNASDMNVTANYDITYVNGTLEVTMKTVKDNPGDGEGAVSIVLEGLTVTGGFAYNGSEQKPTITVKDGTTVIPEGEYTISYKDANDNAVTNPTNAGTYTVVITDNDGGNYNVSGETTYIINTKTLTITANDQEKAMGSDDPILTYTQDGLVAGDAITGALTRVVGETVGSYAISQGTLSAGNNYDIDFTGGTLTIYRTLALFSGSNAWATYVAQEDLALPTGLTAYIVTGVNDNSVATTALSYIPKDVAILLQRTDNTNNSYKAYAGTGTDDVSDNKLLGSATTATDIQIHKDYVLYNDRFELAGVSSVGAGKAYLPATALGGTAAPGFLYIGDYNTGVKEEVKVGVKLDDSWYTLDGRKLDKKPTAKGVYVRNGVKVVVK